MPASFLPQVKLPRPKFYGEIRDGRFTVMIYPSLHPILLVPGTPVPAFTGSYRPNGTGTRFDGSITNAGWLRPADTVALFLGWSVLIFGLASILRGDLLPLEAMAFGAFFAAVVAVTFWILRDKGMSPERQNLVIGLLASTVEATIDDDPDDPPEAAES